MGMVKLLGVVTGGLQLADVVMGRKKDKKKKKEERESKEERKRKLVKKLQKKFK